MYVIFQFYSSKKPNKFLPIMKPKMLPTNIPVNNSLSQWFQWTLRHNNSIITKISRLQLNSTFGSQCLFFSFLLINLILFLNFLFFLLNRRTLFPLLSYPYLYKLHPLILRRRILYHPVPCNPNSLSRLMPRNTDTDSIAILYFPC